MSFRWLGRRKWAGHFNMPSSGSAGLRALGIGFGSCLDISGLGSYRALYNLQGDSYRPTMSDWAMVGYHLNEVINQTHKGTSVHEER
jgi:hypothetical protein